MGISFKLDAWIPGEVLAIRGIVKVQLVDGVFGDLHVQDSAARSAYLGKKILVRIIMLNRNRRELALCPESGL
jgi:hypothetical protein